MFTRLKIMHTTYTMLTNVGINVLHESYSFVSIVFVIKLGLIALKFECHNLAIKVNKILMKLSNHLSCFPSRILEIHDRNMNH